MFFPVGGAWTTSTVPFEPERLEGRTLARSIRRRNAMDVSQLPPSIEDLFLAASARRDVNERAAYLDEACGRDTDFGAGSSSFSRRSQTSARFSNHRY